MMADQNRFCQFCEFSLKSETAYCPNCGSYLGEPESEAQPDQSDEQGEAVLPPSLGEPTVSFELERQELVQPALPVRSVVPSFFPALPAPKLSPIAALPAQAATHRPDAEPAPISSVSVKEKDLRESNLPEKSLPGLPVLYLLFSLALISILILILEGHPMVAPRPIMPSQAIQEIPQKLFRPTEISLRIEEIGPTSGMPSFSQYDFAYVSNRNGAYHIYLSEVLKPTEWIELPLPPGYEEAYWPSFCDNQLAFEAQDRAGMLPSWVFLTDLEGGSIKQWNPPGDPPAIRLPRCSHHGNYLAYSINDNGSWSLLIADLNRQSLLWASSYSLFAGYVSWSETDDFFISMTSFQSDYQLQEMRIVNGWKGLESKVIEPGMYPALSPNGNMMAYICSDQGLSFLCLKDLVMGPTQRLYPIQTLQESGFTSMPSSTAWSRDGKWIYFSSAEKGNWDIFRIRPDGTFLQNLTVNSTFQELMPELLWAEKP